ncbi:MAG: hypothetical protein SynsKO_33950 [Synoicihabitans sp.]
MKIVFRYALILSFPFLSLAPAKGSEWTDLLAGDSLEQWVSGQRDAEGKRLEIGELWTLENGVLSLDREREGRGGFIVTKKFYGDFEMRFEFKISPDGNSGVKYRTNEKGLGLEYQILDDELNRDNKNPTHRAASLYELKAAPDSKILHPAGESWNTGRIVARGNHIEHWLNGERVVTIEFGSADWNERFQQSKYRDIAGFAASPGPLLLQDHRDSVSFRNVRVRVLNATP